MKLKITVDGKVYEAEVEVEEPGLPQPAYLPAPGHARAPAVPPAGSVPPAAPPPAASPLSDEAKVCRCPISGNVIRVSAQVGQTIQINDVLMVLEAMKMETVITAPFGGKVARVNAKVGDFVQARQVLVELE